VVVKYFVHEPEL